MDGRMRERDDVMVLHSIRFGSFYKIMNAKACKIFKPINLRSSVPFRVAESELPSLLQAINSLPSKNGIGKVWFLVSFPPYGSNLARKRRYRFTEASYLRLSLSFYIAESSS